MKIGSSLTMETDVEKATAGILGEVGEQLGSVQPDLVLFFATAHFEEEFDEVRQAIRSRFGEAVCLGCTGAGVIGRQVEVEHRPGMSLLAASLPGGQIHAFSINQAELEVTAESGNWERFLRAPASDKPTFLVLADPFRLRITDFLDALTGAYPGCAVLGGVASAAERPGQNLLWVNDELLGDGAVGVSITGQVDITPVVSQGCRPVGRHLVITKARRNVIQQLGGKPAMQMLQEIAGEMPEEDLALARKGLFVGQAINEYQEEFGRGDFLIRNLMGTDAKTGALVIGDLAKTGTTVQFHVRDGKSADEDLRALLRDIAASEAGKVKGALLFSCNGRGTRLWDEPNHDVGLIEEMFGDVPVAGFFCAGEFGPVGGQNFVHGHTASIALLRES